ncbi:transketolase [Neisseria bacilliformis ATCC BAA-1200]|uniref:Transketolase n=1 Tax=Neisseria bacilliformis ATCC BAA-1200 TaxID=888742 RepID=F2BCC9_9NEIS|nr:transketolase [Neisseria bacilliformis ATCC BAA-1200]
MGKPQMKVMAEKAGYYGGYRRAKAAVQNGIMTVRNTNGGI